MIGEIRYYYPAHIWFGKSKTIYTTYDYDEEVHSYTNIVSLIMYDFKDEWNRASMLSRK